MNQFRDAIIQYLPIRLELSIQMLIKQDSRLISGQCAYFYSVQDRNLKIMIINSQLGIGPKKNN